MPIVPNQLSARPCAEIDTFLLHWLWPSYLPRGKLAVLDGPPGCGKSFLTVDLAARLSRAAPMPDGSAAPRACNCILLNAEDAPADVVRPRALAAGADLERVFAAGGPGDPLPQLPGGIADLTRLVHEHRAELLVIDPLSAFLPRSCATALKVREALFPLAALAHDTGCTVLVVRHGGVAPARDGALSLARAGLMIARHPDDPDLRVLAVSKSNLSAVPASLGFRLQEGESGAVVQWVGRVDLTAEELVGAGAATAARRPRERAAEFLREALANGPRPVSELEALAAERGLNWKTVTRAKDALKIAAKQERDGEQRRWVWRDPSVSKAVLAEVDSIARTLLGGGRRTDAG